MAGSVNNICKRLSSYNQKGIFKSILLLNLEKLLICKKLSQIPKSWHANLILELKAWFSFSVTFIAMEFWSKCIILQATNLNFG